MAKQQQHSKVVEQPDDGGRYALSADRRLTFVALVQMLVDMKPQRVPDVATVNAVFGGEKFKSLGEMAEAFRTHPATVRADWRNMGLPGSAKDGWPIGEAFRWYVERKVAAR